MSSSTCILVISFTVSCKITVEAWSIPGSCHYDSGKNGYHLLKVLFLRARDFLALCAVFFVALLTLDAAFCLPGFPRPAPTGCPADKAAACAVGFISAMSCAVVLARVLIMLYLCLRSFVLTYT